MPDLLAQLRDPEAILMMYLADELSPADRAEVERRLMADPALGGLLDELRATQEIVDRALVELDAATPLPVSAPVASRRVGRVMAQWAADRIAPKVERRAKGLPYPWWVYPSAAAASLLFAWLAWWGNRPFEAPQRPQPQQVAERDTGPLDPDMEERIVDRLTTSMTADDEDQGDMGRLEQIQGDVLALNDEQASAVPMIPISADSDR